MSLKFYKYLDKVGLEIKNEIIRTLYKKYGTREQSTDLSGWCCICSCILFHRFKNDGYIPFVCGNDMHYFTLVKEKPRSKEYIIDITADQFGKNEIELFKFNPDVVIDDIWSIEKRYNNLEQLVVDLNKSYWRKEQIPEITYTNPMQYMKDFILKSAEPPL